MLTRPQKISSLASMLATGQPSASGRNGHVGQHMAPSSRMTQPLVINIRLPQTCPAPETASQSDRKSNIVQHYILSPEPYQL